MRGKCFIYKRAIENGVQLDYTDGTKPFDAVVDYSGEFPVYTWIIKSVDGEEVFIKIPLNVPPSQTDSIVNKGNIGNIQYEFLYGRFRSYPVHLLKTLKSCGLVVLLAVLITAYVMKRNCKK